MDYIDTFIRIALDSPTQDSVIPPLRGSKKALHNIQYELIAAAPYQLTQEDVLWFTHIEHKNLKNAEVTDEARAQFFMKGQPCLRTSALAKRYGWGFHFDSMGGVSLIPSNTKEYRKYANATGLRQLQAMKNGRG